MSEIVNEIDVILSPLCVYIFIYIYLFILQLKQIGS